MAESISWNKENRILEDDSKSIFQLKQEIIKETGVDVSVQISITNRIDALKTTVSSLAKGLEREKLKNEQLNTIIQYHNGKIAEDKKLFTKIGNKSGRQSVDQMEKQIIKLENNLQKMNSKNNKLSEGAKGKRERINLARTERVIDSGIYRSIERQLKASQIIFKKLLIERISYQEEYNQKIKEYEEIKAKFKRIETAKTHKASSTPQLKLEEFPEIQEGNKFTEIVVNKQTEPLPKQQMNYELKVRKVQSETGLESVNEFREAFENIEAINSAYFEQINQCTDQCTELEKYIQEVQLLRNKKKVCFYKQKEPTKRQRLSLEYISLEYQARQITNQIETYANQLNNLAENKQFQQLIECLELTNNLPKKSLEESFKEIDKRLQEKTIKLPEKIEKAGKDRRLEVDEILGKTRREVESYKIMKREQFQKAYQQIIQGNASLLPKLSKKKKYNK